MHSDSDIESEHADTANVPIAARRESGDSARGGSLDDPLAVVQAHSKVFHKKFKETLEGKDVTAYPITLETYQKKVAFVKERDINGVSKNVLKKAGYHSAYRWDKYALTAVGDDTLIYKNDRPVDRTVTVSNRARCFEDMRKLHRADGVHTKAYKLKAVVKARYGPSIPGWTIDLLVATCPICIKHNLPRKKPKAGFKPLISRGLGERGQVDLIDMQSMPDGVFKFIMNYTCHGIKICSLEALCTKQCRAVAWALYQLFCFIGPPAILQTDNGREFNGMALYGKARKVMLSDEVRIQFLLK